MANVFQKHCKQKKNPIRLSNYKQIYFHLPNACWLAGICVNIRRKYGEQTDKTSRCAFTNCPSAANVTSTKSPRHSDSWNPADKLLLKLFQHNENCSSSAMLGADIACGSSRCDADAANEKATNYNLGHMQAALHRMSLVHRQTRPQLQRGSSVSGHFRGKNH